MYRLTLTSVCEIERERESVCVNIYVSEGVCVHDVCFECTSTYV